jgi:hypothetical protein
MLNFCYVTVPTCKLQESHGSPYYQQQGSNVQASQSLVLSSIGVFGSCKAQRNNKKIENNKLG